MVLMDYLQQGGPIMWVLLGCSLIGFTLIFERAIFWLLERKRIDREELEAFVEAVHRGETDQAKTLAAEAGTDMLSDLLETWESDGPSALIEAFDITINRIEKRTHNYLYGLKTVVSVSPLLGILGTVIGIIQSFEVLGSAGGAANPQAVGAGLAQALLTTAFGLMIAVPCLIVHNYFKSKASAYVSQLDDYAEELAFHLEERSGKPDTGDSFEQRSTADEPRSPEPVQ